MPSSPSVDLLRHAVATVAYRARKTLSGAPADFAGFRASPATRTPAEIIAHIGDLFDWALALAEGRQDWHNSSPQPWDQEVARFFRAMGAFDQRLASEAPLGAPAERLFQGPIADALAHVGQIALLRRMTGAPIRGENYFGADVAAGRVGPEQSAAVFEFD